VTESAVSPRQFEIVDVRLARPSVLGVTRGGEVTSSIAKQPLDPRSRCTPDAARSPLP
jgi:hypothetical protein